MAGSASQIYCSNYVHTFTITTSSACKGFLTHLKKITAGYALRAAAHVFSKTKYHRVCEKSDFRTDQASFTRSALTDIARSRVQERVGGNNTMRTAITTPYFTNIAHNILSSHGMARLSEAMTYLDHIVAEYTSVSTEEDVDCAYETWHPRDVYIRHAPMLGNKILQLEEVCWLLYIVAQLEKSFQPLLAYSKINLEKMPEWVFDTINALEMMLQYE